MYFKIKMLLIKLAKLKIHEVIYALTFFKM